MHSSRQLQMTLPCSLVAGRFGLVIMMMAKVLSRQIGLHSSQTARSPIPVCQAGIFETLWSYYCPWIRSIGFIAGHTLFDPSVGRLHCYCQAQGGGLMTTGDRKRATKNGFYPKTIYYSIGYRIDHILLGGSTKCCGVSLLVLCVAGDNKHWNKTLWFMMEP